jgi:hypothetical protein
VYEETDTDAAASTDPVAEVGENTLTVPQAAADAAASTSAVDPFFESGTKGSQGRWNYRQWTPGLERMFAPTEAKAQWY